MTTTITSITESDFGTTASGETVSVYRLINNSGMTAVITNYGGTIISLTAPDRNGKLANIVLGYKTLSEYEEGQSFLGALIGRYGNRIAKGRFSLDDKSYQLSVSSGSNHLHGGYRGFDKVVWEAVATMLNEGPSLLLKYASKDGEEGYPGTLETEVRYTLTNDNELRVDYRAVTDKATPVNLTSHCYFNLCGDLKRDILEHRLEIAADYFTPVDKNLIPTGEYCSVDNSPFDFRSAKTVGDGINADNEQVAFAGGYDHNWVIDRQGDGQLRCLAILSAPQSGRVLKVYSTEPGLQLYTGNFLEQSFTSKVLVHENHEGLCLETQHFPDSPNRSGFPSTVLQPCDVYITQTIYAFSTV